MFNSLKTRGIIIKRRKYAEADRILTIFSEDLGKIEVRARGVRKTQSKLRGELALFNLVKVELVRSRTWDLVINAASLNYFPLLKKSFQKLVWAHFFAEFIDQFMPEGAPERKLYLLVRNLFLDLDKFFLSREYLLKIILGQFQILNYLGFAPRFSQCVSCGLRVERAGKFKLGRGGVYCSRCAEKMEVNFPIDLKVIRFLREPSLFGGAEREDLKGASLALATLLTLNLPKRAKALGFLERKEGEFSHFNI